MALLKKLIMVTMLLVGSIATFAFSPEWNVDFSTIFDNREGDSKITDTKTFFQSRLSPSVGASFDQGRHTLMVGVNWTQPLGTPWREGELTPTLYYLYRRDGIKGALGMFPRTLLTRRLPNFIWSDSAYYCQPNIRGGWVAYQSDKGFAEGLIDWRGMQTETRREAFNIIIRGERNIAAGKFGIGGLAMMNHLALTRHSGPDEHIVDNFLVNPYFKIDLTRSTPLDSLQFRVGALGAITRNRAYSDWKTPFGGWMEADVEYKRFSLENTLYVGGKLFPYYSEFGAMLDQGEPYFRSDWYERASVAYRLVKSTNVDLRASLDFNFAKSNFTFYQRIILGVTFGTNPPKPERIIP